MSPTMRRILFCSHVTVTKTLGSPKVLAEVAEGMTRQGWDCTILGPEDIFRAEPSHGSSPAHFGESLRRYLSKHASGFDVVDYDHTRLPFPRDEFAPQTLMVARSVLLLRHLLKTRIPHGPTLRQRVGSVLFRRRTEDRNHRVWVTAAQRTLQEADLVNVSNRHDRRELIDSGIDPSKIVVLPYGIGRDRRAKFDAVSEVPPAEPRVGFVGTFDYRKGAREMPRIFSPIAEAVPKVEFKLLGTAGMFETVDQVLGHFPSHLRSRIHVTPRFKPEELPGLLADCSVGIFPSWLEGFGIGLLEMLAAAVPVIAYDAPGPPEMLPPEHLVPIADAPAMAEKVIQLLTQPSRLELARQAARQRSREFDWDEIALRTSECYIRALNKRRSRAAGVPSTPLSASMVGPGAAKPQITFKLSCD
jgi:glycosyltransferase involved in cell wall biosynthesis